jgi:hypothetical protein
MTVIGFAAELIVPVMRVHNQGNGRNQEPDLVLMPELLAKEKEDAESEKDIGTEFMVMPPVPMPESIGPDQQGDEDHQVFKALIINDICPKNG